MIPGLAPCTPASHEPDVSNVPSGFRAFVASPKYHTLPCPSWAYQSVVASSTFPPCVAMSETAVVSTPMIIRVRCVTRTTSRLRLAVLHARVDPHAPRAIRQVGVRDRADELPGAVAAAPPCVAISMRPITAPSAAIRPVPTRFL